MNIEQRALRFACHGASLVGIVDVPERPLPRGVLMLADGAQYRVGGHRQFTLLSRALAARGIPVMRFDRRGTGDSDGPRGGIDSAADDIRAAMKEYFMQVPEMKEIVILGLGDGANAAVLHASADQRVRGLVLLNPDAGVAAAPRPAPPGLARLIDVGFWKKVAAARAEAAPAMALPQRLAAGLAAFHGQVLLVVGGADSAATDFARLAARHRLACRRIDVAGADHHFARRAWRDDVATRSADWIMSW